MPAFPRWRYKPQQSSFNTPVQIPTVDPDEGELVQVCFSIDWLPYVLGSLAQLQQRDTWIGTDDEKNDAIGLATNLIQLFDLPVCETGELVQAPFWDDSDGDDADDEATPDEQEWFGIWDGETFLESLSYWAVTAFLATGISEGAAIEFITPLRQFRLLLKGNEHGAKLLILMDSNIFQLVDTFRASDEVIAVDIVSPGTTMTIAHTGEHNPSATPDGDGNYTIGVIKKRLFESEVKPDGVRVNTDTDIFQISTDGGSTWVDAPDLDPRTNPAYFLPPLTPYSGIACDVAARMTAQLKDTLGIFLESGDAAQFATGALGLLVLPFGLVGWFVDLLLFIANGLIDVGQENISDAFTDPVWDAIMCEFSCAVDSDGRITQERLDEAYDQIETDHAGVVANVIGLLRFFFGDVPMLNAGVVRDETGACDECACRWVACVDLTASMELFEFIGSSGGTWDGGIKPSVVLVGGDPSRPRKQAYFQIPTLDSCTITKLEQFYTRTCGVNPGGFAFNSYAYNSYAVVLAVSTSCDGGPYVWDGTAVITNLQANIASGGSDSGSSDLGDALLTLVRISGIGDPPSQLVPYLC